jgi:hypothetical protein
MTVTISSTNPRSIRAIEIAATGGQWLKCKSADGQKAYGAPSCKGDGRYYLVTSVSCDCQDAHAGQSCKHVLAVRLHCELAKAQQPKAKRERPVLDMVREPDGSFRWEAHSHADGSTTYLRRRDQAPLNWGCVLRNADCACSHQTAQLPPIADAQAARIFAKL